MSDILRKPAAKSDSVDAIVRRAAGEDPIVRNETQMNYRLSEAEFYQRFPKKMIVETYKNARRGRGDARAANVSELNHLVNALDTVDVLTQSRLAIQNLPVVGNYTNGLYYSRSGVQMADRIVKLPRIRRRIAAGVIAASVLGGFAYCNTGSHGSSSSSTAEVSRGTDGLSGETIKLAAGRLVCSGDTAHLTKVTIKAAQPSVEDYVVGLGSLQAQIEAKDLAKDGDVNFARLDPELSQAVWNDIALNNKLKGQPTANTAFSAPFECHLG